MSRVEKKTLTVYSLPSSGGGLVAQLGLLSEIYDCKASFYEKFENKDQFVPDLVFSSSGGNVAAYISMAGQWTPNGILRICHNIESPLFVRSWFPSALNFFPTSLIGIFKRSIYKQGYGGQYIFNSMFDEFSIKQTEIWTGAYDSKNRKAQFFCNRSENEAYITTRDFQDETQLFGAKSLKYMNGNVNMISDSVLASAAIPFIVSGQQIDSEEYADGGIMYASPTSAFTDEIYKIVKNYNLMSADTYHLENGTLVPNIISEHTELKLRSFYISSYDMDYPQILTESSTIKISELSQLIHTSAMTDRALTVKLLLQLCGGDSDIIKYKHFPNLKKGGLTKVLPIIENCEHCVCMMYPCGSPSINITNFNYHDIEKQINITRAKYGVHIWYY